MLPGGFDAYVQVLHPAQRCDASEVRWQEIADWPGLPLLPGGWFQDLEDVLQRIGRFDRGSIQEAFLA